MKELLEVSCTFLEIPFPHSLKQLVLDFLLVLVTVSSISGCFVFEFIEACQQKFSRTPSSKASETVSNNALVEFLMTTSVFEALINLLSDGTSRQKCGYQAILLLTLIVNYRKYESTNPYIMKLSIADNELALNVSFRKELPFNQSPDIIAVYHFLSVSLSVRASAKLSLALSTTTIATS